MVRVGAYFHDLGKSLSPKHFVENLEPGETSPHDQLPPELSCDAIFRHVTDGIVTARRAGLHDRVVDFMHMHHGNGVLEYFWAKCQEQGNLGALTIEHFRYPGVAPQTRETAILAICDAVEAASRTLKKPDTRAIEQLVQSSTRCARPSATPITAASSTRGSTRAKTRAPRVRSRSSARPARAWTRSTRSRSATRKSTPPRDRAKHRNRRPRACASESPPRARPGSRRRRRSRSSPHARR
jgi:putative nucleotidyltransferase with HDIG domain